MTAIVGTPVFAALLLFGLSQVGCATYKPPEISYDADVPPLPTVPTAITEDRPRPLHMPPAWTVARGGTAAGTPTDRVTNANAAVRVEPRREGYYNSIQIYPWSEGALYQVYAAPPGQITNIALEPGESLTGAGPIAADDTSRWIIGDTESGSGATRRVHVLVKPSRADISTNLVITTDRRIYMIELRAGDSPYMPATPVIPAASARNYRYGLTGDNPHWKPVAILDNLRRARSYLSSIKHVEGDDGLARRSAGDGGRGFGRHVVLDCRRGEQSPRGGGQRHARHRSVARGPVAEQNVPCIPVTAIRNGGARNTDRRFGERLSVRLKPAVAEWRRSG